MVKRDDAWPIAMKVGAGLGILGRHQPIACILRLIMKATALPRPIQTGCNVSPVDGRPWKAEAAGSNPATQTNHH